MTDKEKILPMVSDGSNNKLISQIQLNRRLTYKCTCLFLASNKHTIDYTSLSCVHFKVYDK